MKFSPRYLPFAAVSIAALASSVASFAEGGLWIPAAIALGGATAVGLRDATQRRHAILRNYPLIGHARFILESIRPEIRQYLLESDRDEVPFSREQRNLIYQRAKGVEDKKPFGTSENVTAPGYSWITHSAAPVDITSSDFRTKVGGASCLEPYDMSLLNISAMSFGALSGPAILSLNKGAKMGGFAHDTGEGSISRHHRAGGGDLIFQVASGYFGCRNDDGSFSAEKFSVQARDPQVKMIELKLSQGAKPGHGGMLPAAKITDEIAEARGIAKGRDCVSPASHSSFSTPLGMMQFLGRLRELSGGKPVGIKLCIGHRREFMCMVKAMMETGVIPDFITIDGSEGGTGAAPLEFANRVGMPMLEGLVFVHNTLRGANLREGIKLGVAGKIVSAFDVARALALGADFCNSARGFMFAVGCIQAQSCHTNKCPVGIATQDPGRAKAIDVGNKSDRVARFHSNTMKALAELAGAAGLHHPEGFRPYHFMFRQADNQFTDGNLAYPYLPSGFLVQGEMLEGLEEWYGRWNRATAASFAPGQIPEGPYSNRSTSS